ncbi:MAG: FecR domain-containing protein [Acidobacteriia bacterium]|nr:FecR domain-containing protein [Terriglobia bacterium]
MKSRSVFSFLALGALLLLSAAARPAAAHPSHARIVRLSLVQGDVRFTRSAQKNDPLADQNLAWESAIANLPIRQGYVLSTAHGRAEVEFENGATAYLDENTVVEFYDLSLDDDGARTTRLILRQGSASFYVNPARGDLFSVTGGDFTAQAGARAAFRMDNYDDGSTIGVEKGRVTVLAKSQTTALEKGQSLSLRAGDDARASIGRLPAGDAFDQWVSARSESVTSASNSALQYVSSPYYSSGFADLYTYGSFISYSGYGNCWRPFGMGLGWSPFSSGQWVLDASQGWSWVSFEPWGWLPYHFGSWVFSPAYGWLWVPGGFGTGTLNYWRPATAVWVRSGNSVGVVPVHPLDTHGKTPVNLAQAGISPSGSGAGDKWKVLKAPPPGALASSLAATAPPVRLTRVLLTGTSGVRAVSMDRVSSIVFDPREHRFVNAANSPADSATGFASPAGAVAAGAGATAASGAAPRGAARTTMRFDQPRRTTPPAARTFTPPPARSYAPPTPSRSASTPRGPSPRSGPSFGTRSAPSYAPRSAPPPRPH